MHERLVSRETFCKRRYHQQKFYSWIQGYLASDVCTSKRIEDQILIPETRQISPVLMKKFIDSGLLSDTLMQVISKQDQHFVIKIWDKVFKNRPSKICGRQPLKNFTCFILEYFAPYVFSLNKVPSNHTVSKTLEISRKTPPTWIVGSRSKDK